VDTKIVTKADEIAVQRAYYADTADHYDQMHLEVDKEHELALDFMIAMVKHFGIHSILDVGSGTGRALRRLKTELPGVVIVGVEPSAELRAVGYLNGVAEHELIDGDAMKLAFADNQFDLVCEFAALHHIPSPCQAVSEMLRVARTAIFISDCNSFGQGSMVSRMMKQTLKSTGLWPLADWIKTKGRGYTITEGDGLGYSYSVFSNLRQIKKVCPSIYLLNTKSAEPNLYRTATHVALLGVKGAGVR